MITITDRKQCCGCSSCAQICPNHCIIMQEDLEGFLYPAVNSSICTKCGLCEQSCPIKNAHLKKDMTTLTYVAYVRSDDLRMKSSSGGMFTLIAEKVLKQKGVIFGAAFDEDFLVHHIVIHDYEDLKKLRGSKYLQSRIENTYYEVLQFLEKGCYVLFTGTGCQIAGLKAFLNKDFEKLYTVDVLCHGAPSPKVWARYLDWQKNANKSDIDSISFRNKETGWKNYSIKLQFFNNNYYSKIYSEDIFMKMFLQNICLRPSCYMCRFKDINRISDITIGDCWGIDNYIPEMDDDMGTSIVLIHSEKGKTLFESLKNQMVKKEVEVDLVLPPTADSRKSVTIHPKREAFFNKLNSGVGLPELSKLIQPTLVKKIKIKIRTALKKYFIMLKEGFLIHEER